MWRPSLFTFWHLIRPANCRTQNPWDPTFPISSPNWKIREVPAYGLMRLIDRNFLNGNLVSAQHRGVLVCGPPSGRIIAAALSVRPIVAPPLEKGPQSDATCNKTLQIPNQDSSTREPPISIGEQL